MSVIGCIILCPIITLVLITKINRLKMPVKDKMIKLKPLSLEIKPINLENTRQDSYVEESLETPVEILPNLYLGSSKIAENSPLMHKYKIQAILNVAKEVQTPDHFYEAPRSAPGTASEVQMSFEIPTFTIENEQDSSLAVRAVIDSDSKVNRRMSMAIDGFEIKKSTVEYTRFNWSHYQEDFSEYLNLAFSYIEKYRRKNKNIMVHCQCGVSRSASVVIAYIMYNQKIGFHDALALVKSKSPTANPHISFICQLIEFENSLNLSKN
eukprot:NODE_450_length_8384_cov_0.353530.p4 type:complete len:267 gc:universal NODE_450_length_8384_cov_0.353530:7820-7020(-)